MEWPKRKRVHLESYDYSQPGYYFVTICTKGRLNVLRLVGPDTIGPLTHVGQSVEQGLSNIPAVYPHISLEKYCIMPNHLHIILAFGPMVSGPTLGRVVGRYKAYVTRQAGCAVWQDDYYDRILRSEMEYLDTWRYIDQNPLRWAEDEYHPGSV